MRKNRLFFGAVFFIIFAAGAQHIYDSRKNYFDNQEIILNLPDSKTLKIVSLGYEHFVGNLLYVWSIQLFSSYNIVNSYNYIDRIFNTITDLIPEYRSPYIIGAMIMAHEKNDPAMAIKLLKKGGKNNPDDWYFHFEAAFYAFQKLKDYKMAEELFKTASEKPGAPEFINRRTAHMIYMSDNLERAWKIWMEIKINAKDDFQREAAENHLYQIKFEIDKKVIDEVIKNFKKRYNRFPLSLKELFDKGLINKIPSDYRGNSYLYDNKTGKFSARKALSWKKLL